MFSPTTLPMETASAAGPDTGAQTLQQPRAAGNPLPSSLNGFFWPAPLSALYGKAQPWTEPQECELEGINGAIGRCALVLLSPADQTILIQIERTKAPVTLAFSQFRRLTLKKPIYPQDLLSTEQFPGLESRKVSAQYQLQMHDGSVHTGLTAGYVETPFGLFTFTPLDDRGTLERVFIPRESFVSMSLTDHVQPLTPNGSMARVAAVDQPRSPPAPTRTLRLNDYLADAAVVSREQLMLALDHQSKMPTIRVGEALLRLGFVSETQLQQALAEQSGRSAKPLGELLIQAGALTRRDLNTALARKMGYPVVDVTRFPIEYAALEKIPLSTARRLMVLPLLARGELTVVASPDPTRREFLEELEFLLHGRVIATLGDEDQISQTMTLVYDRLSRGNWQPDADAKDDAASNPASITNLLEGMELHELGKPPAIHNKNDNLVIGIESPPTVDVDSTVLRLVNTMITEAANSGATDIHVEVPPDNAKVRIRFRQDGRLEPFLTVPHTYRAALLARLKAMANLDLLEHRKPQEGRIDFHKQSPSLQLQLRMLTIPTANGLEDVVLKLLPATLPCRPLPLDQLDLSPDNLEGLRQAVNQPHGMVLCVGPADSGKAATLHAVLASLGDPKRKIWSAQAKLDILQPEARQVQVNPHIGWTFAAALRSFLQADADILMADELPDGETAQVAVEAALTGHLLLSTLPTHSATETVRRLTDMGVSPFSLADALQAVLAQKLVRRFCMTCRTSEVASAADIDKLLDDYLQAFPDTRRPARQALLANWSRQFGINGALHTYHAAGCSDCEGSGMPGRLGLHEFMRISPGLRRLIQASASAQDLVHAAFEDDKFRTLRQDGITKVLAGLTSMDDVWANTHV